MVEPVRTFMLDELGFDIPAKELTEELSLIESGLLDSMGIYQLIGFLEEHFGIHVDDEDVVPDHFENLGAIRTFVEAKQAGHPLHELNCLVRLLTHRLTAFARILPMSKNL